MTSNAIGSHLYTDCTYGCCHSKVVTVTNFVTSTNTSAVASTVTNAVTSAAEERF